MACTKVLIVDQEQAPYETLKPALMRHGYEIHTTAAIQRACAACQRPPLQVALVSLPLASETSLTTRYTPSCPTSQSSSCCRRQISSTSPSSLQKLPQIRSASRWPLNQSVSCWIVPSS